MVQAFRANDLSIDTGKQFELGKSWCKFLEIDDNAEDASITLTFKPLNSEHEDLNDRQIELKLSSATSRGDRKAYADGATSGHSAIKEFFLNDLHLTLEDNSSDYFAIYKTFPTDYYLYYIPELLYENFIKLFKSTTPEVTIHKADDKLEDKYATRQIIFYGTPGSGKSNKVKKLIENIYSEKAEREKYVFRTTFHPDSDYASFVGCYKPRMEGDNIKYEFTPQAFTDAYVKAWQEIKEESGKNVYLIIEEINRGNCAQIFGDLFQLLDRKNKVSEYPINADADLRQYLEGDNVLGKNSEGIAEGKLKLPSNLYIWATMNTSDQSLFPMDSAFKRRWTWECVPIDYEKPESSEFTITIQGKQCNWHKFLREINAKIKDTTDSEDKQMGNFFINGNVDESQFVDKVMFYLWNDVFKEEYKTLKNHFRIPKEGDDNGEEFTFNDLFDKKDKNKDSKLLIGFMEYLKVPLVSK